MKTFRQAQRAPSSSSFSRVRAVSEKDEDEEKDEDIFPHSSAPIRVHLQLLCIFLLIVSAAHAAQPAGRVEYEQKLSSAVPLDLTFRDERGTALQLGSLIRDRPVILALAYYDCPSLCTVVLNGLLATARELRLDVGRDFDIVVVSIQPGETTALAEAKHHAYTHRYGRPGTAGGWHFLTGDAASIGALAAAVGFHFLANGKDFAHPSGIVVLTPQGLVSRYFLGIEYPPRDVRLALVEASRDRIGTLADRLTLMCSSFDPHTGRYSLLISRIIRALGLATVLALGSFICILRRRETSPTA